MRVKEDKLIDKKFRYANYDKNTREFLVLNRKRLEKEKAERTNGNNKVKKRK